MQTETPYDVAILGGGFAGSATALLLLRERPELRLVLVERRQAFDRGVGESTVEVSGHFLRHVLGITDHLNREHLPKQGLRFWFHDGPDTTLAEASEIGPRQLSRMPAWQLDRAVLDEHVLGLAVAAGAELRRPLRVRAVILADADAGDAEAGDAEAGDANAAADLHRIECEGDGATATIAARYVVDASGRAGVIARPRGWIHTLQAHPIAAVWARFGGVRDLDSADEIGFDRNAPFMRASIAPRRLATNHFCGRGYWIWAIPLRNGETSLGAVWDTRHVRPEGASPVQRLQWFLRGNPVTRALTDAATMVAGDGRGLGNLAYLVDHVAGPGWSMVGDAAGFLDPFYSPGIDQLSWSICATVDLATDYLATDDLARGRSAAHREMVAAHDVAYRRFFRHYFDGIYRDKYELLGDYDLLTASVLIDTGLYYLTTVESTYRRGFAFYRRPPFYRDERGVGRWMVAAYKGRLLAIARRRLKLGHYGKRNTGRRALFAGFSLGWPARRMLIRGLLYWGRAELEHWASFLWPRRVEQVVPTLPWAAPGSAEARSAAVPGAPEGAVLTPRGSEVVDPGVGRSSRRRRSTGAR